MIIIKFFTLFLIFGSTLSIGFIIAKKYSNRVKELKDMKNALNIFETKIRFTYESVPEIFAYISGQMDKTVSNIFQTSCEKMKEKPAGQAWMESIDEVDSNMNLEDKTILKSLGKLLGKTDAEGQISEIQLVNSFLDGQIDIAESERTKNEKMYKTLGGVIGLTIVIILI